MHTSLLLGFCLFLCFSHSAFAQTHPTLSASIDSLIHTSSPRPFSGVVYITQKDKPLYTRTLGYAHADNHTPLTLNSRFEVMSISKQVTAVLILKEVENGKINLHAPIATYLPTLTQPWAKSVTVHHLLSHTHGIISLADTALAFAPGTDFKYGNLSNVLLGEILTNTTGKSYATLANALFRSLKMRNTHCYDASQPRDFVFGHAFAPKTQTVIDTVSISPASLPANGVVSCVKDLAKWNKSLHKGAILSKVTYRQMTTPTTLAQHNAFGKEKVGYGYGIRIDTNATLPYVGHTGMGDGFAAVNLYFPAQDVSIIVLENIADSNFDNVYHFGIAIKTLWMQRMGREK